MEEALRGAYGLVWEHLSQLIALLVPLVIVIVALQVMTVATIPQSGDVNYIHEALQIISSVFQLGTVFGLSAMWVRYCLGGEWPVGRVAMVTDPKIVPYLMRSIVLLVFGMLAMMMVFFIGALPTEILSGIVAGMVGSMGGDSKDFFILIQVALMLLALVAYGYINARLCVWPVAILFDDRETTLVGAWQATERIAKEHTWGWLLSLTPALVLILAFYIFILPGMTIEMNEAGEITEIANEVERFTPTFGQMLAFMVVDVIASVIFLFSTVVNAGYAAALYHSLKRNGVSSR